MRFALLLTLLAACSPNESGNTSVACAPITRTQATPSSGWGGTVFTIVMENRSASQIFGNPDAPFINQLAAQNATARGYHDAYVHPSEPNYLWLVSGENFGILDDNDPGSGNHVASASHLADQIERAGLDWRAYQEGMGAPCGLSSHGGYAAKHDPFVYFDDIDGWDGASVHVTPRCAAHVVDYAQLDGDLASGAPPRYAFITPSLDHDMHDGSIADGDAWLAREVPKILASDAFNRGGVLFLLWDEGGGLVPGDDPPFLAVSPNARRGYVSTVGYDQSSYLKTVEEILGLEELPCSRDPAAVPAMDDLFAVPLAGGGTVGQ